MGWWVDDVTVDALLPMIVNDALVDAGGAAHARARAETLMVPEPGYTELLLSGILGLAAIGRRRYRR